MKPSRRIALAILVLAVPARSEDQGDAAPWTVGVDVEIVSVSPEQGGPLIPQLRDPRSFGAAFERLQKIIADEPAALLAWPLIRTRSGEPCEAENSEDRSYQDPDGRPGFIEIRRLGPELRASPVVQTGGTSIQIEIATSINYVRGLRRYPHGLSPIGFQYVLEVPEFSTLNVTTTLSIANGGRLLLGSFFVPSPSPHVVLFILHATAVRADFPNAKTPTP